MTEKERIKRIAADLELIEGQWTLSGSGILIMHDIQRAKPMGDVDIFVSTRLWMDILLASLHGFGRKWGVFTPDPDDTAARCDPPFLYADMYGIEVNIFSSWRRRGVGDLDVAWLIHNAKHVDGIPCYDLQFILDWKRETGRAKDVDDIRILEEYLA
jgi:hypothetical protein